MEEKKKVFLPHLGGKGAVIFKSVYGDNAFISYIPTEAEEINVLGSGFNPAPVASSAACVSASSPHIKVNVALAGGIRLTSAPPVKVYETAGASEGSVKSFPVVREDLTLA
jgi:hypothetical protein